MNPMNRIKPIGMAMVVVATFSACDKPGPAETAGRQIDQTTEKAGQKISDAADKASAKINEQGARTTMAIDDAEVTARVKSAIFGEPGLSTLQIAVTTVDGVVTLEGTVDSTASGERATLLAKAMSGVKDVNNRLVVAGK